MDEKTPNIGWVYFVAILFCALGLTIFLWKGNGANNLNAQESAIVSPASGIFIIPAGGEEISRDTAGQRFFPNNVGEIIAINTINPRSPNRLFFLNKSGSKIELNKKITQIRITDIDKKPYISFANYGNITAKIKVRH